MPSYVDLVTTDDLNDQIAVNNDRQNLFPKRRLEAKDPKKLPDSEERQFLS